MSSIVNKVKEVLHSSNKDSHSEDTHTTHGTAGQHNTTTAPHGTTGLHSNTTTAPHGTTGLHTAGDNRGFDGPATTTDGPNKSNLLNKADPRVDSDRDHSHNLGANPHGTATTTSTSHQTGTATTTGAHHSTHNTGFSGATGTSGFGNESAYGGSATRTDGPHNSNLLNKADPRVDSDRDHSHNLGANPHGTATTGGHYSTAGQHGTGLTGTHNTGLHGDNRGFDGPATRTDGPYTANIANKADPRVDSDRDHSRNLGANPHGTASTGNQFFSGQHDTTASQYGTTGQHSSGLHGTGLHGDNRGFDGPATRTDGPHTSNVANKADPRIDSDRDYSTNLGANSQETATAGGQYGTTGQHGTTAGQYGTTDQHGTIGTGIGGVHSTGPAPNTAGPHKSDMLNKTDPRVDSNLDGSKTYGGDKTHAQNDLSGKDPTDAAQVPPSVLQQHIGAPQTGGNLNSTV